jgi:hypothetical protein
MKLIYGNYYCTEDGRVFNYKKQKEVTGYFKDESYLYITIRSKTRKTRNVRKHRMVYEYFYGPIPDGYVINHLDGNKTNNAILNLEMTTPKGNAKHAGDAGLLSGWSRKPQKTRCIETGEIFKSIQEAERKMNLGTRSLRFNSKEKKRLNNSSKGFTFEKV